MSNLNNRIKQLEKDNQPEKVQEYLCHYYSNPEAGAVKQNGYDVVLARARFMNEADRAAQAIHFETLEELDEFAARPDVELTRIVMTYEGKQPISTFTSRDYSFVVGVDMGEI